jgi:hypothetical protein
MKILYSLSSSVIDKSNAEASLWKETVPVKGFAACCYSAQTRFWVAVARIRVKIRLRGRTQYLPEKLRTTTIYYIKEDLFKPS